MTKSFSDSTGWTNGGIGSFGAIHEIDDGKNNSNVMGVYAFRSVASCTIGGGCSPELAWYFCASAFEVGMSSNFGAMVYSMIVGPQDSGGASPPAGPSPIAIIAAKKQRHVLHKLRNVPVRLQKELEIAYMDNRCPTPLVVTFGVGIAPLVWSVQRELSNRSDMKRVSEIVIEKARAEWPTYEPEGTVIERIKSAIDTTLWTAHQYYDPERYVQRRPA